MHQKKAVYLYCLTQLLSSIITRDLHFLVSILSPLLIPELCICYHCGNTSKVLAVTSQVSYKSSLLQYEHFPRDGSKIMFSTREVPEGNNNPEWFIVMTYFPLNTLFLE